jgi:hypothetical protein
MSCLLIAGYQHTGRASCVLFYLSMEAAGFSEMSESSYQATGHQILEVSNRHIPEVRTSNLVR